MSFSENIIHFEGHSISTHAHAYLCPSIHQDIQPSICIIFLSLYLSISLSLYLSIPPSLPRSIYLSICLSVYLSIYRSIDLSIYRSIDLSIYRSIDLSIYRSIDRSIYLSIYPSIFFCFYFFVSFFLFFIYVSTIIYLSIYRSINLSIYRSIHLSIDLSIHPSIHSSIHLPKNDIAQLSPWFQFLSIHPVMVIHDWMITGAAPMNGRNLHSRAARARAQHTALRIQGAGPLRRGKHPWTCPQDGDCHEDMMGMRRLWGYDYWNTTMNMW